MTDTPTLRLERVKVLTDPPGKTDGWPIGPHGVTLAFLSLSTTAWAALESALDTSWAETILEQRDAALTSAEANETTARDAVLLAERMRPVVEAAVEWRDRASGSVLGVHERPLAAAVDHYRQTGPETDPGATLAGERSET